MWRNPGRLRARHKPPQPCDRHQVRSAKLPGRLAHPAPCLRERLVDAQFPLKTIGDYIGHRDPKSTEIYSKIDLETLRDVAFGDGESVLASSASGRPGKWPVTTGCPNGPSCACATKVDWKADA